ncbi:hypothetical protein DPMN_089965 [Dreissena polymorpha]|uniref:Uncharacterized protein n=1 Tax=Dreissena polymorpha TaxID=45954 RepID=A0A9D4QXT0_DREPO|nr:hypothetical protein DPMN_089965 [Dreissena polymorpha]
MYPFWKSVVDEEFFKKDTGECTSCLVGGRKCLGISAEMVSANEDILKATFRSLETEKNLNTPFPQEQMSEY